MAIALVLMGVTGSGKSTIGEKLAAQVGWTFLDGDDFHPDENVQKMARGLPLTDEDRAPWLQLLAEKIGALVDDGVNCILACSSLKAAYRQMLSAKRSQVRFVHLTAPQALIGERLKKRQHRYMPAALLQSQFDTLEDPKEALSVDVSGNPDEAVEQIIREFAL